MILVIVIGAFILLLTYLYGSAALISICRLLRLEVPKSIPLPLLFLTGMVFITIFALIANLFIPLGSAFIVVLSVGAVVIAARRWILASVPFPPKHSLIMVVLVLVFLTVLENATHIPSNPDTGLYHAQTIRWFETYHIVPGLGNLQERYAFNSAWLVLNASLSLAFLGLRSFHLVNGLLFLTAMLFFCEGLYGLSQKKLPVSGFIKILFLPLGFYLLAADTSSAGNDMPIALITWMILALWLERIESPLDSDVKTIVIFLLAFFSIIVKLSSLPMLGFAILILIEHFRRGKTRQVLFLGAIGGLILLPWLIRSVILSGYLVFPISQIDLFSVDWKMPREQIDTTARIIVDFARLGNSSKFQSAVTFWHWAPIWFERHTLNRKAIYMVILLSPFIMLASRARYCSTVSPGYLFAYWIAFAGSIFWFVFAPDIRFGYGFLIGTCVLALAPILVDTTLKFDKNLNIFPAFILLALIVFQTYTLWHSVETPTLSQRWLLPGDYRSSNVGSCGMDGMAIYCRKEGGQCQYDAFPCIPSSRLVEMRGSTFQDGFRSILTPDQ